MYAFPQPVRHGPALRGLGASLPPRRAYSGRRLRLRGLGQASALTSAEALQQAVSLYHGNNLNPAQFQNSTWMSGAQSAIEAGQFSGEFSGCSGTPAPSLQLFSTASGLSLSTASSLLLPTAASSTPILSIPALPVPVIGAVIAAAAGIITVIRMIFAHHAAAVSRDNNFGCSVWPAVNNAFSVIAQAVQGGQMTPAAAAAALPEIYSQAMSAGGASGSVSGPGGIPGGGTAINNSPWCNSNCELSVILLAMVLYWQAQYQAMAATSSAGPLTSASSAIASTGLPSLLVWALGGFLVYELIK